MVAIPIVRQGELVPVDEESYNHTARVCRIGPDDKLYISLDVDSLDPAFAPGTGTPEPGGIATVDLLRMVRRLALEHDVVGMDVVEVAPAYDVSDLTVNAAHRMVFEAMGGMAERRRRTG